jgi:integrase
MVKSRSVERDVQGFCGWEFLLRIREACGRPVDKALIAALFETGGRVSEVLQLKKSNFVDRGEFLVVDSMPVLKKKEKSYRTFPIPKWEPLTKDIEDYLNSYVEKEGDRLFPFNRVNAFFIIRQIGGRLGDVKIPFSNIYANQLYPHWFRAMRATQLKSEYDFDAIALASFFGWKLPQFGVMTVYSKLSWEELSRRFNKPSK